MGTLPSDLKKLTEEIRKIYSLNPAVAEYSIEVLLLGELEGQDFREKLAVIDGIKNNPR